MLKKLTCSQIHKLLKNAVKQKGTEELIEEYSKELAEKIEVDVKEVYQSIGYERTLQAEEKYVINKTSEYIDSLEATTTTKNKVKQRLRKID